MDEKPIEATNIEVEDIRMIRPVIVHEKPTGYSVTYQEIMSFKVEGCDIKFFTPNIVALLINNADEKLASATSLFKKIFDNKLSLTKTFELNDPDTLASLYDYFELIQSAIIFMYTGVEALANIAIPDDYIEEKISSKGIKEIWDKKAIERWYNTSEKLGSLLPKIANVESPKHQPYWSNFKQLEDLRNSIVHPKTSKVQDSINSDFYKRLLDKEVFQLVKSGFSVIKYYCDNNEFHNYFPIGVGKTIIKSIEVDNFSEYFTKVK